MNDETFKIQSASDSQISRLSVFLLTGILPDLTAGMTVNELLADLLNTSFADVIELVRQAGATHENVRKRLAWQLSEANIVQLVKGLEPANHEQVIHFSDELNAIQAKKSIVKASAGDFRKNVWLWIMNYLLAEKGTLFNKVAFMKSSIRQMAAHYNLSHEALLKLIEEALETVKKVSTVDAGFIATLRIVTEDNSQAVDTSGDSADWTRLENYLSGSSPWSSPNNAELSELVSALYSSDEKRFTQRVQALNAADTNWYNVAGSLDEKAFLALASALYPRGSEILEQFRFLDQLFIAGGMAADKMISRHSVLRFMHKHSGHNIVDYYFNEIQSPVFVYGKEQLKAFFDTGLPAQLKTVHNLLLVEELAIVEQLAPVITSLEDLLQAFNEQQANQNPGSGAVKKLLLEIKSRIKQQPKKSLELLRSHPDNGSLIVSLVRLMDADIAVAIITTTNSEQKQLVEAVLSLAAEKETGAGFIQANFQQEIKQVAAAILLRHADISSQKLLHLLVRDLIRYSEGTQRKSLHDFFARLLSNKKMSSLAGTQLAKYVNSSGEASADPAKMLRLVRAANTNKQGLARLLLDRFFQPGVTALRKSDTVESRKLLNFFVQGSDILLTKLLTNHTSIIGQAAQQQLRDLFWKALLNYPEHNGNIRLLERYFNAAIVLRFPVKAKQLKARLPVQPHQNKTSRVKLSTGQQLSPGEIFQLLHKELEHAGASGAAANFSELLGLAMQQKPLLLQKITADLPPSAARLHLLNSTADFSDVAFWIASGSNGLIKDGARALWQWHGLLVRFSSGTAVSAALNQLWEQLWLLLRTGRWNGSSLVQSVQNAFAGLPGETGFDGDYFHSELQKNKLRANKLLQAALLECMPSLKAVSTEEKAEVPEDLATLRSKGLLNSLVDEIVLRGQSPSWYAGHASRDAKNILNNILVHYPGAIRDVALRAVKDEAQLASLHELLDFNHLIASLGRANGARRQQLAQVAELYAALGHVMLNGVTLKELQQVLFAKVIQAWTSGNWRLLSAEMIWNELLWDLRIKKGIPVKDMATGIKTIRALIPPALLAAWDSSGLTQKKGRQPSGATAKQAEKVKAKKINTEEMSKAGIQVRNAGLVILNSYIPLLFERLMLTDPQKKFVSAEARMDAVHYLQYLVTGLRQTEESLLVLNKVLCGLGIDEPVKEGIEITTEQEALISGLIKAAIGYWPGAGDTSVAGFRGNWLVRDGILREQADRWELTVEKRAYDLLIHKSPFTFSIIKYPWMDKPLHVNWPY